MPGRSTEPIARVQTASQLRREISARNLFRAADHVHETTHGSVQSVVYSRGDDGSHGNFYPAAYRRIAAQPAWARRLDKAYTASDRVPRSKDRQRRELDCAVSSDALLMNIFCAPGTCRSTMLCSLLNVEPGLQPHFGVRTRTPLRDGFDDRTEADMQLGDLLVEAKFSESGFGSARPDLMLRYPDLAQVFDVERLPRTRADLRHYQLLRGVLAAQHLGCRFALFCDARRPDLQTAWFDVLSAVSSFQLRSRLLLVTWQEIATCLSRPLQIFLADKYGITSADSLLR